MPSLGAPLTSNEGEEGQGLESGAPEGLPRAVTPRPRAEKWGSVCSVKDYWVANGVHRPQRPPGRAVGGERSGRQRASWPGVVTPCGRGRVV